MPAALPIPETEWRDGALYSRTHDDCYASRNGARAEREHVFLKGNGFGVASDPSAIGRWRDTNRWTIGELGFGAGLTFLSAWAAFCQHAASDAQLDWVSVEGAPLDGATLEQAALCDPAATPFTECAKQLARAWPARVRGIHRRSFCEGRVRLTLLFGDVLEFLPTVDFRAHAWCLDGFAPARNPEMWSEEALKQVAYHTAKGGTLATYAAASAVGQRIAKLGFQVERVAGAVGKRQMITARMAHEPTHAKPRALPAWFAPPAPLHTQPAQAIVIGAGLAGAAAARALAERNISVTILDAGCAAGRASAAPRAVLAPHLASWQSPQTRITAQAFLHARYVMNHIGAPTDPCGLLHPVDDDDEWGYTQAIADWGWPDDLMQLVSASRATEIAGSPLANEESPHGAVHVRDACTTRPIETVRCALLHPLISLHEHTPVARLHHTADGWEVITEDGRTWSAETVVVATAGIPPGALLDMPEAIASGALPSVPFDATRGQLSTLSFEGAETLPRTIISAHGFAMPPHQGAMCAGATYEHERLGAGPSPHDDAINLSHVARLMPALAAHLPERCGAWAGIRTAVSDHCPVIGPVVADAGFRTAFRKLPDGPLADQWPEAPYLPGLFVTLAHGSRGTSTAFLAAELLADIICGTPRCVSNDLLPAIMPQRFLVREIRSTPLA